MNYYYEYFKKFTQQPRAESKDKITETVNNKSIEKSEDSPAIVETVVPAAMSKLMFAKAPKTIKSRKLPNAVISSKKVVRRIGPTSNKGKLVKKYPALAKLNQKKK